MNVHDSDRMRRMIRDAGYAEVQRYEDADLVVLNTCYVRENAVDRVKGHLGELSRLKKEGRVSKVALTGLHRRRLRSHRAGEAVRHRPRLGYP
jgi:tRNA-2-methylthio-N6-dimethylallyladenosine synthase